MEVKGTLYIDKNTIIQFWEEIKNATNSVCLIVCLVKLILAL